MLVQLFRTLVRYKDEALKFPTYADDVCKELPFASQDSRRETLLEVLDTHARDSKAWQELDQDTRIRKLTYNAIFHFPPEE